MEKEKFEKINDMLFDQENKDLEKSVIKELKKIKVFEEDPFYKKGDADSSILTKMIYKGLHTAVDYVVSRDDVSSEYVDVAFEYACRRVEKECIDVILESGKTSLNGLSNGIRELKIEAQEELVEKVLDFVRDFIDVEMDEEDEDEDYDFGKKKKKTKKPAKKSVKKSKKTKKSSAKKCKKSSKKKSCKKSAKKSKAKKTKKTNK